MKKALFFITMLAIFGAISGCKKSVCNRIREGQYEGSRTDEGKSAMYFGAYLNPDKLNYKSDLLYDGCYVGGVFSKINNYAMYCVGKISKKKGHYVIEGTYTTKYSSISWGDTNSYLGGTNGTFILIEKK